MGNQRWSYSTLLTNDNYLTGAVTLAQSLRNTGTQIPLCVLVVEDVVSQHTLRMLPCFYDKIITVPAISGVQGENLSLIGRPDLHSTLSKLHLWSLEDYDRVLYLDADTLVLRNLDHLFELPEDIEFAASPELGFPDCFNSGVMLLKPGRDTYLELRKFAIKTESFDGGDQGLLNTFFGDGTFGQSLQRHLGMTKRVYESNGLVGRQDWYRLSFTYNMEMHKVYRCYIPAVLRYEEEHKVLHFIGVDKPWHFPDGKMSLEEDAPAYVKFYARMVEQWWDVRRQADATLLRA